MNKYMRELVEVISGEGLVITDVKIGKHIKFCFPEGCMTVAKTPGDRRNMRNIRSHARRLRSD